MSQQPEQKTAEFQLRINDITNLITGHKGVISGEVHWSECIPALAAYVYKQTASLQKQLEEWREHAECRQHTILNQKGTIQELREEAERLKRLLRLVLPMAEDGYTLSKQNGAHQEFLSDDRELLAEIKQALNPQDNQK